MPDLITLLQHEDFSIIEKPEGLSCHNDKDSVIQRLGPNFHLVHRLDRETSGLLMVTQKPELQDPLQKALHEGQKEYVALLRGILEVRQDWQIWNWPITDKAEGRALPQGPKNLQIPAETRYRCLRHNAYFSWVHCRIHSGRQHQIRKHSALAGRPVVGDARYGNPKDNERVQTRSDFHRMALHAHCLNFKWKGISIELCSPVPEEFSKLLPP